MRKLYDLPLPKVSERLWLPAIDTDSKKHIQKINRDVLSEFIQEHCYRVSGSKLLFSEFYDAFIAFCDADEVATWSKRKTTRDFPRAFPVGTHNNNKLYIGNIAFDSEVLPSDPWRCDSGRLVRDGEEKEME